MGKHLGFSRQILRQGEERPGKKKGVGHVSKNGEQREKEENSNAKTRTSKMKWSSIKASKKKMPAARGIYLKRDDWKGKKAVGGKRGLANDVMQEKRMSGRNYRLGGEGNRPIGRSKSQLLDGRRQSGRTKKMNGSK